MNLSRQRTLAVLSLALIASCRSPTAPTSGGCDESLWAHVYNPSRLQVLSACRTVTGTIQSVRTEADGDLHVQLRVDDAGLLNAQNRSDQDGALVLEPICQRAVTQASAVEACLGFSQPITIPAVGVRVSVTGSYVLDREHGWNEIHPVSRVEVVR